MWLNKTKNPSAIIVENDQPELISRISVMKKNDGTAKQEYIAVMVCAVKEDNGLCEKLIHAFNLNELYCYYGKIGPKYVYFKPQSNEDFQRFIAELCASDKTLTKDIEVLLTQDAANYHYEDPKPEQRIERPFLFGSLPVKEKDNKKTIRLYYDQIQQAMSMLDEYRDTLSYSYDNVVSDIATMLNLCSEYNPEYLVDLMHAVIIRSYGMMKDVYGKINEKTDPVTMAALFDAPYQEACKKHAEYNRMNPKR